MRHPARSISLLLLVAVIYGGCASGKPQGEVRDGEYRRVMELQKQKAEMISEEEISRKIPDMKAGDHELQGDGYFRQGNMLMAYMQYAKALQMAPDRSDVHYKIGRLFLKKGMAEEALGIFEKILATDPRNALAYEGKGVAYLIRGNAGKAKENFLKTLELDPKSWRARGYLGVILDREKKFAEAAQQYSQAIEINPGSTVLYNNLGMSCFLNRDYDKAASALIRALKIDPSNTRAYNNLGLVLCKAGKYHDAIAVFKKGVGDEAGAYNNIGYLYMLDGKYNAAAEAFWKAIELKPAYYVKASENMKRAKMEGSK